jgi:radical SAM superfamily enzyme YgiQ (UPF0313 family)
MAHITFISLYDRNAYGLRVMSARLKSLGHKCDLILLKRYDTNPTYRMDLEVGEYPWMGINKRGRVFKYASNSPISAHELDLLVATLRKLKPDVVGMTVNTPLRVQCDMVTKHIKKNMDIPVIWGGYDPTVNPEQCLALCDYACIGEGDDSIVEIANAIDRRASFDNIPNLAYVRDGQIVVNDKHPVEQNLDSYPWRDNEPEGKYFIEDGKLIENYEGINDRAPGEYETMSARGCPYRCSYCCEATLKDLYSGEKFLRRRSVGNLIAELKLAKQTYKLTKIQFNDEIFGMNLKWLEEFAPLYKKEVGVPFVAYIYPSPNIEKILITLKEAGMNYCCLALESGSENINKKVFDRVYNRALFLKTVHLCKKLGIDFYTDIITYNPYETEADVERTLSVLLEMGGGYDVVVNKLFVLPGTRMAEQMKIDGVTIPGPEREQMFNYYARLFWLSSFNERSVRLVKAIHSRPFFRRHRWLINPAIIEPIVSPRSAMLGFMRNRAPNWLYQGLKKVRRRIRGDVPAPAPTGVPAPACN